MAMPKMAQRDDPRYWERRLQAEGLGSIDISEDSTHIVVRPDSPEGGCPSVDNSPSVDSDWDGLVGQSAEAHGGVDAPQPEILAFRRWGSARMEASDLYRAVNEVQHAAHGLPTTYRRRAFLVEWSQTGFARPAARKLGISHKAARVAIAAFLRRFKLANPWAHSTLSKAAETNAPSPVKKFSRIAIRRLEVECRKRPKTKPAPKT